MLENNGGEYAMAAAQRDRRRGGGLMRFRAALLLASLAVNVALAWRPIEHWLRFRRRARLW